MRVLIVDDDAELADLLLRALAREGHAIDVVPDLTRAREVLLDKTFDVIVLDLALPDGDGLSLCRELRAQGVTTPILVLTASGSVPQRVAGLDAGADDYLAKPFAVVELRARLRALGRRREQSLAVVIQRGDVALDLGARRARRDDLEVELTAKEWVLLDALARRRGRVARRSALLEEVWGDDAETANASLEVLISRIRRKLGRDLVRTVRGMGYALESE